MIYRDKNKIPKEYYLIETHAHTFPVSPCASIRLTDLIDVYKNNGYQGIFVTNHYKQGVKWDVDLCKDKDISVMFGFEVKFSLVKDMDWLYDVEILVYGASPDFLKKYPDIHKAQNLEAGIKRLRELLAKEYGEDFLMIQAHPYRYNSGIVYRKYLDGVELWNSIVLDEFECYKEIMKRPENIDLLPWAGTDCHHKEYGCMNGIVLHEWDGSVNDFIKQVKNRNYDLYVKKW